MGMMKLRALAALLPEMSRSRLKALIEAGNLVAAASGATKSPAGSGWGSGCSASACARSAFAMPSPWPSR